ncbi:hypothetical protein ACFPPD_08240 [Cohnella suwonensis]|uniref:Cytosolic protein n=1 Tax=Cohnella suwonensis TaxID=696072 RepID=A0ABW0LS20_9BACL
MFPFRKERKQATTDLKTVESRRNDLAPEEFPEGPYGFSAEFSETLGKSTPWRDDQRPPNPFSYENRELHAGLDRGYPGDHEVHSENERS